jgi:hypothetical protein
VTIHIVNERWIVGRRHRKLEGSNLFAGLAIIDIPGAGGGRQQQKADWFCGSVSDQAPLGLPALAPEHFLHLFSNRPYIQLPN